MAATATDVHTASAAADHDELELSLLGFLVQTEWDAFGDLPPVPRDEAVVSGRRAGAPTT